MYKELSLGNFLSLDVMRIIWFVSFLTVYAIFEMQKASFVIWIRLTKSTSNDDKRNNTSDSNFL